MKSTKPAKPKPIKVWALWGYRYLPSDDDAAPTRATFAMTKDALPFGGWSRQGLVEIAAEVRIDQNDAARRWYADQHRPRYGNDWHEFLASCGGVGSVVVKDPDELRQLADLIAAHVHAPPPGGAP